MKKNLPFNNWFVLLATFGPLVFYALMFIVYMVTIRARPVGAAEDFSGLAFIAIIGLAILQYLATFTLGAIIFGLFKYFKKNVSFWYCVAIIALLTFIFPAWYIISGFIADLK